MAWRAINQEMKITNFPKPNYKVWDDVKILDHLQVVCLWAELEPSIKASKQESCNAIHRVLEEARMEGLLRSDVVKEYINGKLEYNVIFHRKDLIAYAEITGRRPAFLFPEERIILDVPIRTNNSSTTNPAAPSSEAKAENLPDTAVELSSKEDVQKTQTESDKSEQPSNSGNEYPEEICELFDPLSKSAILLLFSTCNAKLEKGIDRASRNRLCEARVGRGKFNPAKTATWLIQKGLITQQRADAILKIALPPRSKHDPIADDYFNKYEID